jgi:glutaredoxin 2
VQASESKDKADAIAESTDIRHYYRCVYGHQAATNAESTDIRHYNCRVYGLQALQMPSLWTKGTTAQVYGHKASADVYGRKAKAPTVYGRKAKAPTVYG